MGLGSGDGRCLFRSVVRSACLRAGKPSPIERQEREVADDLRAAVGDEFIKRRADAEWFVEGDFDSYVARMRQPHVWGGEPELLMSSHVLQVPITVYMWDKEKNCLKIIASMVKNMGRRIQSRFCIMGIGIMMRCRVHPMVCSQSCNFQALCFPLKLKLQFTVNKNIG